MPIGHSREVLVRLRDILALLADGCKTTSLIQQRLGLSHGRTKALIYVLEKEGRVTRVAFGNVALVCLSMDQYRQLVDGMIREVERLVTTNKLKFISPPRLYDLIIKDPQARKFFSSIIPIAHRTAIILSFLNHLLKMIYGEPYVKTDETVYLTANRKVHIEPPAK
jgi:hypothetical protein